jgi:hypothetical protein
MTILIPLEGSSPTGLQAKELMGLTVNSINELSDSDVQSFNDFYTELYTRAFRALEVDAQRILSGFFRYADGFTISGKFHTNKKLTSLITSQFISESQAVLGQSGVRIQWSPTNYAVASVGFVEVNIKQLIASPTQVRLSIIDNVVGSVIWSKTYLDVTKGVNRLPVFQNIKAWDFTIVLELSDNEYYQSQQSFLNNGQWLVPDLSCRCSVTGITSTQINDGGVNAYITAMCSLEEFINYNFELFKYCLYYKIAVETMKERIASDRINQYTMLTIDRATQLLALYEKDYTNSLETLRDIQGMPEDGQCFTCRKPVYLANLLP